jgi:hypothetical protein
MMKISIIELNINARIEYSYYYNYLVLQNPGKAISVASPVKNNNNISKNHQSHYWNRPVIEIM